MLLIPEDDQQIEEEPIGVNLGDYELNLDAKSSMAGIEEEK